jgi:cation:H+ antiporter
MFSEAPLWLLLAAFTASGLVILVSGLRMTGVADRLADRTGVGEAMIGGVLLGAATSLSGTIVSFTAALDGRVSLAFSNGYRDGSLYHAAGAADYYWLSIGLVMSAMLTLGMIIRQKEGPGGIGVESAAILAVYGGAIAVQALV